jgi:hypothetical protein
MIEAASTSEKSINIYQTARRNIPDDKSSSYSPPLEAEILPKEIKIKDFKVRFTSGRPRYHAALFSYFDHK